MSFLVRTDIWKNNFQFIWKQVKKKLNNRSRVWLIWLNVQYGAFKNVIRFISDVQDWKQIIYACLNINVIKLLLSEIIRKFREIIICFISALPFIIAMLLASLNSCCNPWIYLFFAGHLFHDLLHRCLRAPPCRCERGPSRKSPYSSSTTTATCAIKSAGSQRSLTQTSTAWGGSTPPRLCHSRQFLFHRAVSYGCIWREGESDELEALYPSLFNGIC